MMACIECTVYTDDFSRIKNLPYFLLIIFHTTHQILFEMLIWNGHQLTETLLRASKSSYFSCIGTVGASSSIFVDFHAEIDNIAFAKDVAEETLKYQ